MDLVIQSFDLPSDAVAAFKVAALASKVQRKLNSARLVDIHDDIDTHKAVAALASFWKCDAAFVRPDLRLSDFRVLAMDMDSTLINIESLDEVAALAGKGAEVAAITEAAMRGEIADYVESLRRRVAMLAGGHASLLQRVWDERLQLNPGAETLIGAAKRHGLKSLLVTGGFTFFTDRLQQRLGFDSTHSNELTVTDSKIAGMVTGPRGGPIVDAAGKAQAVRKFCAAIGCSTDRAIVIGDGANDLQMMKLAGLSVAYNAKPVVRAQASQALNYTGLDGLLNWFVDSG